MKSVSLSLVVLFFTAFAGSAQDATNTKWWNPATHQFPVVEGQLWRGEVESPYDRLPLRAKDKVRPPVWGLSKHAAGLMIRFRSNASEIKVRYQVSGNHAMPHMPATGVSGVDLYAIDSDGQWHWARGRWSFGDTIAYRFSGLKPNDQYHQEGREYRLYLPLYNQVEWMEIGVADSDLFKPLPVRMEKPIVVYGTSIAQGACASRPGMAWTSILGRKLDRPVINLAFSGNGRLEEELTDLLVEATPKVFIVDCLPNLVNAEQYDDDELTKRVLHAVRKLKKAHPSVPVLLADHAGYTDGGLVPNRLHAYERVNQIQQAAFQMLKMEGQRGIFYITKDALGLELDDMVDGTHPNDLGMQHYAEGYETVLRKILNEPIGEASTTQARVQYREPGNYDWEERHRDILQLNQSSPPKMVILANSIVHFWGGLPRSKLVREAATWEEHFTPAGIRNLAYGWDRVENVLWRVYHGELDGFEAEKIMIMIGTNNLHLNTNKEIIVGLDQLVEAIKIRQPKAEILLMGILPRREQESRVASLNLRIAQLAGEKGVSFNDIGSIFLQADNKIREDLFSDGLHPNAKGYQFMGKTLQGILLK